MTRRNSLATLWSSSRVWPRDLFLFGALGAHLAVALAARVVAWPEVTTPAYLMSRGMLLYRDIKFVHTPGLMALLALAFVLFGVTAGVVRGFAILGPLAAHAQTLHATRGLPLSARLLGSGLFLVCLLDWDASAVWPSVLMMPLSLLIASDLSRGRLRRAALLIGIAILIKQTAAYVLLICVLRLIWRKRVSEAPAFLLWASLPYASAAVLFGLVGAGTMFLQWTLVVPFRIEEAIAVAPPPAALWVLAAAALPLAMEAALEKPGEYEIEARWLLAVALGFMLMIFPRFGLAQAAASIPCLALGAARLLARSGSRLRIPSYALVGTIVLTRGAGAITGTQWDSRIEFWNGDPAFNVLAERLRSLPRDTPLATDLFDNIYPRSGLAPPGRIYYAPWLAYLAPYDSIGERVRAARRQPGVVWVSYRTSMGRREGIGPFLITSSAD